MEFLKIYFVCWLDSFFKDICPIIEILLKIPEKYIWFIFSLSFPIIVDKLVVPLTIFRVLLLHVTLYYIL